MFIPANWIEASLIRFLIQGSNGLFDLNVVTGYSYITAFQEESLVIIGCRWFGRTQAIVDHINRLRGTERTPLVCIIGLRLHTDEEFPGVAHFLRYNRNLSRDIIGLLNIVKEP